MAIKRNKKAGAPELVYMFLALIVFSMLILIGYTIYSNIDERFQAHSDVTTRAKAASTQVKDKFTGVLDNSFLLLAFIIAIGALIMASLVRVHPAFFVAYLIALVLIIFMSGVFSNIYQQASDSPELAEYAADLTFVDNIMNYLPFFVGVVGSILAIVMFKLRQEEIA